MAEECNENLKGKLAAWINVYSPREWFVSYTKGAQPWIELTVPLHFTEHSKVKAWSQVNSSGNCINEFSVNRILADLELGCVS